uniref:Uncharacterized protein n=1 Tax=Eptatretus burgeri TaxID=7764 RepID=A0A8C4R8B2_EPTBU
LLVTDVYSDGVKLTWKDPAVAVTAYRVSVFPEGQKDLMSEVLLDPPENMVELQYLRSGEGGSMGRRRKGRGGRILVCPPYFCSVRADEFACVSLNKADIVLLVDGSWNVGRSNFNLLRRFLIELVEPFEIGLVQYSRSPRTEWDIDTHLTKEDLLKAIAKLSFMGGISKIGEALKHLLESTFVDGMGTRVGVPRAVVLITDGHSDDDVAGPAQALKEAGVIVFIIGMRNAERQLLEDISSKPMSTFIFHLDRFTELDTITAIVSQELCSELTKKVAVIGVDQDLIPPSALKISDKTARSMWLSWNAPPGPVEGYLIVYAQLVGGFPLEVVSRDQTSMFLENLEPNTEYHISVSALYPSGESKSVTGTENTLPSLDAMSLRFQDVTSNTMEVAWPRLDGVTGYTIVYSSLGDVVDNLESFQFSNKNLTLLFQSTAGPRPP